MRKEFIPLMAITALAALAIWFFALRAPSDDGALEGEQLFVLPTYPIGLIAAQPEEFRWRSIDVAKSYEVEILDVTMKSIWKGKSSESSLVCPPEVRPYLAAGQPLFYTVTARGSFGKELAKSEPVLFQLSGAAVEEG